MVNKKDKTITNLELLESVNRSFSSIEAKMATKDDLKNLEKKIEGINEEVKGIKNQLEGTNKRIDDLAMNRVKYEDYDKLKVRVDFIEEKLEI